MRLAITVALSALVFIALSAAVLHLESSIAKEEYVKPDAPVVTLESSYDEGSFAFEGSLETPTHCTQVSAAASLTPEGVIRLDVSTVDDEDICLMLSAAKEFSAELAAPEESQVIVYVNGVRATSREP